MRQKSMVRRQFAHFAGAATAFFAPPYVVRSQAQARKIGVPPPLSARDRLEEALIRIADPNGEGARLPHCLFASRPQRDRGGRRESACRHDPRSTRESAKKKGGSPSSKPPARTKFALGSTAAPACIRRQNFTRRFVGCASRQEPAKVAKKRFAATCAGLYALPFCR
jgi:hypothetical protein